MLPHIKAKARKLKLFVPHLDIDDAIQEGRLALLACLARFDYNKASGELVRYVSRALTNTYHCMLYETLAQCRMPHAFIRQGDEWIKVPRPPLSLDAMLGAADGEERTPYEPAAEGPDAEEMLAQYQDDQEMEEQACIFKLKMLNKLKGRDYEVFMCLVNPPCDFLVKLRNEGVDLDEERPTSRHIGDYLGHSKNAVDWSIHKIKLMFTKLSRSHEFDDLFVQTQMMKGQPMITMSTAPTHDADFVRNVIRDRKLDTQPLSDYAQRPDFAQKADKGRWSRMIIRYPWGVELVIKKGDTWRTMVIEGRFNPLTGEVFGDNGMRERIPASWYPELVRKLKEESKNG